MKCKCLERLCSCFKSKPKADETPSPLPVEQPSPFAAPTINFEITSRSYNDTPEWRRKTLRAVPKIVKKAKPISGVVFINKTKCVKVGRAVQLSEAATLMYVAKMSSVPVPKVYCAFEHDGMTYIMMERIDGEEIRKDWGKRSEDEKNSLLDQLRGMFDELHNIPHPRAGVIMAADGQGLYNQKTWKGKLGFGPFAEEKDFHNFLRVGTNSNSDILDQQKMPWVEDEERHEIRRMIHLQDSKQHRTCFVHGDASSFNILVKDGKVVGLIDFELSGFYPEYWEYTSAWHVNGNDDFWRAEVPKFLREFPDELEMEHLRRKHFRELGFRSLYPWS